MSSRKRTHKNKYAHLAKESALESRRWRACERKRRYNSPDEIRAARGMGTYRCRWCAGYHLYTLKFARVQRAKPELQQNRRCVVERIDPGTGLITEFKSRAEIKRYTVYKMQDILLAHRRKQKYSGFYWNVVYLD